MLSLCSRLSRLKSSTRKIPEPKEEVGVRKPYQLLGNGSRIGSLFQHVFYYKGTELNNLKGLSIWKEKLNYENMG